MLAYFSLGAFVGSFLVAQDVPVYYPQTQHYPTQAIPAQSIQTQYYPTQSIPIQSTPIQSTPIQSVPVQSFPNQSFPTQSLQTQLPQVNFPQYSNGVSGGTIIDSGFFITPPTTQSALPALSPGIVNRLPAGQDAIRLGIVPQAKQGVASEKATPAMPTTPTNEFGKLNQGGVVQDAFAGQAVEVQPTTSGVVEVYKSGEQSNMPNTVVDSGESDWTKQKDAVVQANEEYKNAIEENELLSERLKTLADQNGAIEKETFATAADDQSVAPLDPGFSNSNLSENQFADSNLTDMNNDFGSTEVAPPVPFEPVPSEPVPSGTVLSEPVRSETVASEMIPPELVASELIPSELVAGESSDIEIDLGNELVVSNEDMVKSSEVTVLKPAISGFEGLGGAEACKNELGSKVNTSATFNGAASVGDAVNGVIGKANGIADGSDLNGSDLNSGLLDGVTHTVATSTPIAETTGGLASGQVSGTINPTSSFGGLSFLKWAIPLILMGLAFGFYFFFGKRKRRGLGDY